MRASMSARCSALCHTMKLEPLFDLAPSRKLVIEVCDG